LPAGDAAADGFGERHLLGRPQRQILVGAAARLVRAMRDKGWTVPHWPKEYGGGGLDPEQAKIVRQEMPRSARGSRDLVRHFHARAGAAALRHRGAEERTSA